MTKYGDSKCLKCEKNRYCYSALRGIETYGYGSWSCIKDNEKDEEIERLKDENGHLRELIQDIIQDRDENYKRIPVAEQVGISYKDFY